MYIDYPIEGQEISYYLIQQVSNQQRVGLVDVTMIKLVQILLSFFFYV
jgi:hypothetical protein